MANHLESNIPVRSGVPRGTVLGPLMFVLYIHDIGENTKAQIGVFADDAAFYGVIKDCNDAVTTARPKHTCTLSGRMAALV